MNESLEKADSPLKANLNIKIQFILVSVCLILSLLVVVYIFLNKTTPTYDPNIPDPTQVTAVEDMGPRGSIYLTLSPLEGDNTGIYEFNFEKKSLTPFYEQPNGLAMTGRFEESGDKRLLVSEYLKNNTTQIVAISGDNKERTVLTNSPSKLKRHPLWSNYYSLLIYSARPESGEVLTLPDEFSVYTLGSDGLETELTKGSFPVLTPDGKSVVVLRNDGLTKVDLFGNSTEKIWGYDSGDGLTNQMFNISPNGQYIAWTFPDRGKIYVSEVLSWSPFKFRLRFIVEAHAFWPIFSPDNRYLAYEEVDWTTPPSKPRLVVFDLNPPIFESRVVYDLSNFNQMRMFISDWRIH